ncbi:MAG: hypothetical protein L0Z50_43060 [Verrucomicrobiales bacterium]|nr:hypothetical protein [Verrucomicrobiales bacterium]
MFDEFKSILPIFHAASPRRPDVFGTGTLIKIGTHPYLLTAAHVLDEKLNREIYVPLKGRLTELRGRYLCSARRRSLERSDDLSDICVIQLPTDLAGELESRFQFVPSNLLDPNEAPTERGEYEFTGFPTSRVRANIFGSRIKVKPYSFGSRSPSWKAISKMGYNPNVHLVIYFKRQKNRNEKGLRVTSPKPNGVSGGGVWRVWRRQGLFGDSCTKRLVGIATEYDERNEALIGIRLSVALDAICKMCPDLANSCSSSRFVQFVPETRIEVPVGGYHLKPGQQSRSDKDDKEYCHFLLA